MRRSRSVGLFLVSALLAGCTATARPAPVQEPVPPEAGPVSMVAAVPAPPPVELQALQQQLEEYLARQEGTWGAHVIDIVSGQAAGVNSDQVFPAASTFKLPMAMYVLAQVEQGQASLEERLAYSWEDWADGSGTLQDSVQEGDTYSIRELLELAITQSDNIATHMLLRRFGTENVYAYMERLGGRVTLYQDETWGTTPREMATYMRLAQHKATFADPKLRQFLLDLLAHTAFDDRAAAGVPRGVKVAHKVGTLPGVVNDVALVFAPRRTFVLSVYSMDVDEEAASGVIAELTRRVYAFERRLASQSQTPAPTNAAP